MAYPNPREAPKEFLEHLKSSNLGIAVTAFLHYQIQPTIAPNGRFDEGTAQEWCERMDTLLGKLNRVTRSQPNHQDALTALDELCAHAIADLEDRLVKQKEADEAEAKRLVEEEKKREEMARLSAEKEEKERQEKLTKMAQDQEEIQTAERELAARKEALRAARKAADVVIIDDEDDEDDEDEDDDDDDEQDSESAAEEPQGTTKKKTKRQTEASRKKLPQTVYSVPCAVCARNPEVSCTGPTGHACNVCWKQKKSCTNGGRRRRREVAVKEEPKSPGHSIPSKRKVYSTTDANAIGRIETTTADFDPAQGSSKRQKTGSTGSAQVRFHSVTIPKSAPPAPKATRRSARNTKASSKKGVSELFERLGQEFQAVAKTFDDLAEAMNTDA